MTTTKPKPLASRIAHSSRQSKKQKTPDGILIHCQYSDLEAPENLTAAEHNPNTHSTAQLEAIARVIEENGWRSPVVLSRRSGRIVRGHGRWLAAQRRGWSKIPIQWQDYADASAELADLTADNRLGAQSDWDAKTLARAIADLGGEVNLQGFGLSAAEENKLARIAKEGAEAIKKIGKPRQKGDRWFVISLDASTAKAMEPQLAEIEKVSATFTRSISIR